MQTSAHFGQVCPDKQSHVTFTLQYIWPTHRDVQFLSDRPGVKSLSNEAGTSTNLNNSHTVETQHNNTGIHANSWFLDQSTQMASWKLAYCWIIHFLQS